MQTKTLQQTITFKASPQEVYDMLMDSRKHQSLSGEPAKISKKVGGKFTAWGSHLSGINLVLKPGKKIVQAWRAGSLFHRDLRHHQSAGRLEAQVYADRHSTKPLQWPLPWLD